MPGLRSTSDEEDRAEVEVLYARLEKTVYLTKKIQSSLIRLETSGGRVKEAIGPIYGNTQKLQVLGQNIDRVNEAIEKLREPLDIKGKEERIIRAGPGGGRLSEFLRSLERVSGALARLQSTNLRSNQDAIADFSRLVKTGSQQLEAVFQEILREDARGIEPLFYITKQKPFPTLAQDNLSRLGLINAFVASPTVRNISSEGGTTPTARIYGEIRGQYVKTTLQNLAAASVTTAKKRIPDAIYQRDSNGMGTYRSAIEGCFLAEFDNICNIFSRDDWGLVFRLTCRGALTDVSNTLRELNAHIRANLMTDCFLAYEIVDIISRLSFSMESKTGELKNAFQDALKPIRETAKSSLAELLDDVRHRVSGLPSIPSDGAVVPVTIDTMQRLQNMTPYMAPLSSILTALGDGNWTSTSASAQASTTSLPSLKSFDVGADGRKLLGHYAMDNIEVLLQNLESKGRAQLVASKSKDNKGSGVLGTFLANNVAMIERMIRNSDLAPLLADSVVRIDFWRKKGKTLYCDAWRETSTFLLDAVHTNRGGQRPPSGSSANINSAEVVKALSSKEKDAIKEKFRNFNASFDTLLDRHRGLVMEREVRAMLGREVQAMIEPLYCRFWDRYHEIDKGKGKYVKYEKGQLVGLLAGLA